MKFDVPLNSQFAAITIDPISISQELPELIDLGKRPLSYGQARFRNRTVLEDSVRRDQEQKDFRKHAALDRRSFI